MTVGRMDRVVAGGWESRQQRWAPQVGGEWGDGGGMRRPSRATWLSGSVWGTGKGAVALPQLCPELDALLGTPPQQGPQTHPG